MRRKRLIFYVGQIEPLDLFTRELVAYFEKTDCDIFIYDMKKQSESLQKLDDFCKEPVDAVITINAMFYNMKIADGRNAWEAMGIKYITLLVDHPDNFTGTLSKFTDNDIVLCIDREHMNYVGRFFPNVATYGFLPHGGAERCCNTEKLLFKERTMDVMYAGGIPRADIGTLTIPARLVEEYKGIFNVEAVVAELYRRLLKNPAQTVEKTIEDVLCGMNLQLEDEVLGCVVSDFMFIHTDILTYYRKKVLETVAQAGIELYIFGPGWERFEWTKLKNVHLMGKISPEQVLEEMNQAKIVLSTMAWFKDGAHERVFNGMLAKALVVSESTVYMREIFNDTEDDKQDVLLFELEDLEILPERIKYMLNHEEKAQQIIERGYCKTKECHTWEKRAEEIDKELLTFND